MIGRRRPGPIRCTCAHWPLPGGSGALRATRVWDFTGFHAPSLLGRHLRYKEHGLPASTLQRTGERASPCCLQGTAATRFSRHWPRRGTCASCLGSEVLRCAPMYVAAATAGLACRLNVVARPDGFEIILSDCDGSTRDGRSGYIRVDESRDHA